MSRAGNDRGFVLVNALIVVAAVSTLAIGVLRDAEAGIARVGALRDSDRAALALRAAAVLVTVRLEADDPDVDGPEDGWAFEAETWPLDDASVTLSTADLQGRFNLNWLLRPDLPGIDDAFRALAADAGLPEADAEAIVARYLARRGSEAPPEPPAGTHFGPDEIALPGEILAELGLEAGALDALGPVVACLPAAAGLNLNTADPAVIAALTGAGDEAVARFEAARTAPFDAPAAAVAALQAALEAEAPLVAELAGVATGWIELEARTQVGQAAAGATVVLRRDDDGAPVTTVYEVPQDV